MSGIARVLFNLGYRVTGSDLRTSDTTKKLSQLGIKIFKGHNKKNTAGAHVVVTSSAVPESNPEVREAKRMQIALVPRAEMLSELMRMKYSVAVAGTHGKTSTTSLVGSVLYAAGFDPTLIIGGKVNKLGGNARLGKGEFLVAEADESDRSFLKLHPTIAVITNIDPEHMENYRNFDDLKNTFVEFANRVPFYGAAIVCASHPVVREILPRISRPCVTYGAKDADYTASGVEQSGNCLTFSVSRRGKRLGAVSLKMAGRHNALNALAAIASAMHLDIPFSTIRRAISEFEGISRRFEILSNGGPIVVDDYAHHPVEISATLAAARAGWPKKRVVAVIQPHRYSRLSHHFDGFVSSLKTADAVFVMDVYPAGERPLKNYTGETLCKSLKKKYPGKVVRFVPGAEEVTEALTSFLEKRDIVLFLGAGSVTKTARGFAMTHSLLH